MSQAVPPYAQQAYAILHARFQDDTFPSDYLARYITESMVKKTLHALETAGWIRRVERGTYVCNPPDQVFDAMIEFRVPRILSEAGMPYAYAQASAVEVWSDYTYIQRSWEHSPYHINIRKQDTEQWIDLFRSHRISVYTSEAQPALGEFVILHPEEPLRTEEKDGVPVEPLETVTRYCAENLDAFEYPLAYIRAKYDIQTTAEIDERVAREAVKAI